MYEFKFVYENNVFQGFDHITKVEYSSVAGSVVVSDAEILQHRFPIGKDMHLFAKDANYTASGKNLKSIAVFKEE